MSVYDIHRNIYFSTYTYVYIDIFVYREIYLYICLYTYKSHNQNDLTYVTLYKKV